MNTCVALESLIGFDTVLGLFEKQAVEEVYSRLLECLLSHRKSTWLYSNRTMAEWFDFWSAVIGDIELCETPTEAQRLVLCCGAGWQPGSIVSEEAEEKLISLGHKKVEFIPPLRQIRGGGLYLRNFLREGAGAPIFEFLAGGNCLLTYHNTIESHSLVPPYGLLASMTFEDPPIIEISPDGKEGFLAFDDRIVFIDLPEMLPSVVHPIPDSLHRCHWIGTNRLMVTFCTEVDGNSKFQWILFSRPGWKVLWQDRLSAKGYLREVSDFLFAHIAVPSEECEDERDCTLIDVEQRKTFSYKYSSDDGYSYPLGVKGDELVTVTLSNGRLELRSGTGESTVLEDGIADDERNVGFMATGTDSFLYRRRAAIYRCSWQTGKVTPLQIKLADNEEVTLCREKPWLVISSNRSLRVVDTETCRAVAEGITYRPILEASYSFHIGGGVFFLADDYDQVHWGLFSDKGMLEGMFQSPHQLEDVCIDHIGGNLLVGTDDGYAALFDKRGTEMLFQRSSEGNCFGYVDFVAAGWGHAVARTTVPDLKLVDVSNGLDPVLSSSGGGVLFRHGDLCGYCIDRMISIFSLRDPSEASAAPLPGNPLAFFQHCGYICVVVGDHFSDHSEIHILERNLLRSKGKLEFRKHCDFPSSSQDVFCAGGSLIATNSQGMVFQEFSGGKAEVYHLPLDGSLQRIDEVIVTEEGDFILAVTDTLSWDEPHKLIRGVRLDGGIEFQLIGTTRTRVLAVAEGEERILFFTGSSQLTALSRKNWETADSVSHRGSERPSGVSDEEFQRCLESARLSLRDRIEMSLSSCSPSGKVILDPLLGRQLDQPMDDRSNTLISRSLSRTDTVMMVFCSGRYLPLTSGRLYPNDVS